MRTFRNIATILFLLVPAVAIAQTEPTLLKKTADGFRKVAAQNQYNKVTCNHAINKSLIVACRDFYQEMSEVDQLIGSAYDAWDKAFSTNDNPGVWEARRQEAVLMVRFRELVKKSWSPGFFGGVWSSKRSGKPSNYLKYFSNELQTALNFRDNFCPTLVTRSDEQVDTCRTDWSNYADALQGAIAVSERLNKASADNEKDAYFDAYIEEAKLRSAVIVLESQLKPKYFGQ